MNVDFVRIYSLNKSICEPIESFWIRAQKKGAVPLFPFTSLFSKKKGFSLHFVLCTLWPARWRDEWRDANFCRTLHFLCLHFSLFSFWGESSQFRNEESVFSNFKETPSKFSIFVFDSIVFHIGFAVCAIFYEIVSPTVLATVLSCLLSWRWINTSSAFQFLRPTLRGISAKSEAWIIKKQINKGEHKQNYSSCIHFIFFSIHCTSTSASDA